MTDRKAKQAAYREKNREILRLLAAEYNNRPEVKERRSQQQKKRYAEKVASREVKPRRIADHEANYQRSKKRCAEWRKNNKARASEITRRHRSTEHGKATRLANVRHRQAVKQNAVPIWADRNATRDVYAQCRELNKILGVKMVVDHIYPLRSPTVCGLHCEANLQILPEEINIRKSNSYQDTWLVSGA